MPQMSPKPLKAITEITSGFAFKSDLFSQSEGIPLIRIRDVVRGFTETKYTGDYQTRYLIHKGDLLIGMDGEFNVGIWPGPDALLNQRVCRLSPNPKCLDIKYLYYFLPKALKEIERQTAFVTVKHLSTKQIGDIDIPLPPLDEQKRIAAILDKADAIRRKRQQAMELADEFLRAVFLDMFGDPVTNPKGWDEVPLKKLLTNIETGWSPNCEARPAEHGEVGVLKLGAITPCFFSPNENKALPSGVQAPLGKLVHNGDLLFSRKNTHALVAACAIVKGVTSPLVFPDLMFRLVPNTEKVLPEYLWGLLVSPYRKKVQELASGAAASMPNISQGRLKEIIAPCPAIKIQEQYSSVMNKFFSQKKQFELGFDLKSELFSSLQHRYFTGKL